MTPAATERNRSAFRAWLGGRWEPDPLVLDDQALIAKSAKEAQQEQRKLWYEMEQKSISKMKEAGVQINDVADKKQFQEAVKPVWDKYGAQQTALIKRIQDVK